MITPDEAQAALLYWLKSKTVITDLLANEGQIKEHQWQGTDFVYPAVRLSTDIIPNLVVCSPDSVEGVISVFDELKSSKRCSKLAGVIAETIHNQANLTVTTTLDGNPLTVKFIRIWVTRVTYPKQLEGLSIWESQVQINGLVN